jgi:hypothetical protein
MWSMASARFGRLSHACSDPIRKRRAAWRVAAVIFLAVLTEHLKGRSGWAWRGFSILAGFFLPPRRHSCRHTGSSVVSRGLINSFLSEMPRLSQEIMVFDRFEGKTDMTICKPGLAACFSRMVKLPCQLRPLLMGEPASFLPSPLIMTDCGSHWGGGLGAESTDSGS